MCDVIRKRQLSVAIMKLKKKMPHKQVPRRPLPKERIDNPKSLLYNQFYEKLVGEDVLITLKCSICFEFFNDPTVLPCGHTFCGKCLITMAKHAKLNSRDVTEQTIGCPSCREHVLVKSLVNRETTLNYPVQQILDMMMKREDGAGGMLVTKPKMVDASTSYDKDDYQQQQMAHEHQARERMMKELTREMDGFVLALSKRGSIISDAFLDIERIRMEHLDRQREEELAAVRARTEKKYRGKKEHDPTDFVPKPAAAMLDPAIVSYSMLYQSPPPSPCNNYVRRPVVPVRM